MSDRRRSRILGAMLDFVLRRLARDHWVRLHGTPRVTVLVGGDRARALWHEWLALSATAGTLLEGAGAFDEQIRDAVARAAAQPAHPIAVLVDPAAASRWRTGRRDRLAAMADEGWTPIGELDEAASRPEGAAAGRDRDPAGAIDAGTARDPAGEIAAGTSRDPAGVDAGRDLDGRARPGLLDARSVAEATLHEALEATAATAGRFRLNESLSVRFGGQAAEIDLLSRGDRIAIEIDGVHHFGDLDCYRRDRRKDLLLQTQGFVVVRLLAEDVMRDVRSAVAVVCQALAHRLEEQRR